jgi:hypothetical protein
MPSTSLPEGLAHFHGVAVAVAGVGEVDAAAGVDGEVVGGVVAVAVVAVGEDGEGAVFFGAGDAAVGGFADDEAALVVEQEAVGAWRSRKVVVLPLGVRRWDAVATAVVEGVTRGPRRGLRQAPAESTWVGLAPGETGESAARRGGRGGERRGMGACYFLLKVAMGWPLALRRVRVVPWSW